jgi:hydroxymethylpyrimidine kinase/phosphomethylpyrimidine kinase
MKRILVIAGSDSSGGAGLQADIKTVFALGAYPMTAVTALTVQNTMGVDRIEQVDAQTVAAQIDAVLGDIGADAIKIGMLYGKEVIEAVAGRLRELKSAIIVVDPVLRAGRGQPLMRQDAFSVFLDDLLPLATVITPNISEAETLAEIRIENESHMEEAAKILARRNDASVVITGGHLPAEPVDILYHGGTVYPFAAPRIDRLHTHGSGCTFASSLATFLAQGADMPRAVSSAKRFVRLCIEAGLPLGKGAGPVNQFAVIEKNMAGK